MKDEIMSQSEFIQQQVVWDQAMLDKYNHSGPRYTSYPTAVEFHPAFTISDFEMACNDYPERPLSLYLHIPFCHKLCYYCGCNKIVTRHNEKVENYLKTLLLEITHRAFFFKHRSVTQVHFGGGTPTFLTAAQLSCVMSHVREEFKLAEDAEISIEVDPREIELEMVDALHQLGFNRLSIGVQDFNKEVQRAVNREQDEQFIVDLIARARTLGFHSINLDMIYGLPHQTLTTFTQTLEKIVAIRPERLSLFNYAHMPSLFAAQRKIKEENLPAPAEKMAILQQSIEVLTAAGYQFIGMDHFALPDDEMAKAQRRGQLHRNFQGYTTQEECDLLGLGVSAISMMGDVYAQNSKDLASYNYQINSQFHAISKGLMLDKDDLLRREIIKALICNFYLSIPKIEVKHGIKFDQYFAEDLALLQNFIDDELVKLTDNSIKVTARGRLLIRNICMCFDKYMRHQARNQQFSRVI